MRPAEIGQMLGVDHRIINEWLTTYDIPRKGFTYSASLRVRRTNECFGRPSKRYDMYEDI